MIGGTVSGVGVCYQWHVRSTPYTNHLSPPLFLLTPNRPLRQIVTGASGSLCASRVPNYIMAYRVPCIHSNPRFALCTEYLACGNTATVPQPLHAVRRLAAGWLRPARPFGLEGRSRRQRLPPHLCFAGLPYPNESDSAVISLEERVCIPPPPAPPPVQQSVTLFSTQICLRLEDLHQEADGCWS